MKNDTYVTFDYNNVQYDRVYYPYDEILELENDFGDFAFSFWIKQPKLTGTTTTYILRMTNFLEIILYEYSSTCRIRT